MQSKLDLALLEASRNEITRRGFLRVTALGSAGFLIGCERAADTSAETAGQPGAGPAMTFAHTEPSDLNAFVRVGADNTVTVIVKHLDKGQGVTTGLPTIVAEELDADWAQMRAEFAPADAETYKNLFFGVQGTGGSTSVANSWMQLRQAAAGARAMLVGAAAAAWGVDAAEITVSGGMLRHAGSGKTAAFGELAAAAAEITPPTEPAMKDPGDFTLIGTHVPRMDSVSKTDGSARFTIDIERPGMLVAVVAHPPRFGATVKSFDGARALALDGVADVVAIPRGVAVLADSYWTASRGREVLEVEWDDSAAESRSSGQLVELFRNAVRQPGLAARNDGDVEAALGAAKTIVSREFEFPYLAHATMEPMDCVIELGAGRCEIWTGAQLQTVDQMVVGGITGLPPEKVTIHTQFAGGSFGRRAVPDSDYIAEAAMIVKAIDGRAPVKLIWSREDDMRGGRYRPMSYHQLQAGLDEDGNVMAWRHRVATQSIFATTPFESLIEDGIDSSAVEGARGLPYDIANLRVDWHNMTVGVPVLWWRSVGHTHNGFATEAFLDEVGAAAGKDPLELRRELLHEHPRHLAVLELAADKAGWGEPMAPGRGRGIAVHESFNSFVAEVVEVTTQPDGAFTVDRVVCAVDCGIAINPDVVRAQMEGGIGYGLSAALREAVTLDAGRVEQGNFDSYQPLRISEMPAIEVHIVPSAESPTGVGEPGTPPVAPALANALFAATGKRIGRLPILDQLKS